MTRAAAKGWTKTQKAVLQMYRRYAGMSDGEYRQLLQEQTGCRSSTAAELTNHHYDRVMALVETRAHLAEINGLSVGKRPARIADWHYWRKRVPGFGKINTRQHRMIFALWSDLQKLARDERGKTSAYLAGIIRQALGKDVRIDDMSDAEAGAVIEALKDYQRRAARARKDDEVRAAAERESSGQANAQGGSEDPFAKFQVSEEAKRFWAERKLG